MNKNTNSYFLAMCVKMYVSFQMVWKASNDCILKTIV